MLTDSLPEKVGAFCRCSDVIEKRKVLMQSGETFAVLPCSADYISCHMNTV